MILLKTPFQLPSFPGRTSWLWGIQELPGSFKNYCNIKDCSSKPGCSFALQRATSFLVQVFAFCCSLSQEYQRSPIQSIYSISVQKPVSITCLKNTLQLLSVSPLILVTHRLVWWLLVSISHSCGSIFFLKGVHFCLWTSHPVISMYKGTKSWSTL